MNVLQALAMQCCLEKKQKKQSKQKSLNCGRFCSGLFFVRLKALIDSCSY